MKCLMCGRKLKDPKSLAVKMGPTCAEKAGIVSKKVRTTYGEEEGSMVRQNTLFTEGDLCGYKCNSGRESH